MTNHSFNPIKSQLREQSKKLRTALSRSQVNSNSMAVIKNLKKTEIWLQSRHIALYLPFNNEIDLRSLIADEEITAEKILYIPSIRGQKMQFHRYQKNNTLITTSYGLRQPPFKDKLPKPNLDLCLMPLLGFDEAGNRLGMGGGFYDRYFEQNDTTYLVGVAHATQQFIQLPIDPWDVKLNSIITEQGLIQI